MIKYNLTFPRRPREFGVRGRGLINTLINKLPFELHIPGYNFCGPGTKLAKRLAEGSKPVTKLDDACMLHDIEYSKHKGLEERHAADKRLAEAAASRITAKDASLGEKAAALGITGIMKAKTKFGMGLSFNEARKQARMGIPRNANLFQAATAALSSIKRSRKRVKYPKRRIIPIPIRGGFLPLIPIFAALSALGALGSGGAAIARAVTNAKEAQKQLDESKRHNQTMESIALGKGLYLKPYKRGLGLFLNPPQYYAKIKK